MQELQNSISILQSAKRNTEQSLSSLQEEYEELEIESKDNKEKLRTVLEQNGHLQSEILIDKNKIHSLQKTKVKLIHCPYKKKTKYNKRGFTLVSSALLEVV